MSVSASYSSALSDAETLADIGLNSSKNSVTFDGHNTALTLNAGSSPAAIARIGGVITLSGGAATLDLTAGNGTNSKAVDGTGLKIRMMKFKAASGNANPITVSGGASNGYSFSGVATWKLPPVPANGEHLGYTVDGGIAVDSTHKTIDFAGTGSQQITYEIVLG